MTPMRVRYFESFTDDFVQSRHQEAQLPADYDWRERHPIVYAMFGRIVHGLARIVYPMFFHGRVYGSEKVANHAGGAYIFINHTQPVGDVFLPYLLAGSRRVHPIVAAANLGVPIGGKLLRPAGALVLPNRLHQLGSFQVAMTARLAKGDMVVMYPEAHVWPYTTLIRPFATGSVHYPAADGRAVYTATTTYQPGRGRRPRMTVYVDGPFRADMTQPLKIRQRLLRQQLMAAMQWRAAMNNTTTYITYRRKEVAP
ncbi:1-acyl-sn-glycerol-3-phosphate acyltransferase [Lacticaseibacillus pabuli]|uniref:1-acyl-sn-glycerol-3-phosphate acyltransferase n=1 Tax=Lacticaseibacillus pabuli TaxID=3025672 RepID=A0ABY7WSS4_9LACO|nr:1-acyl-sn-glycerol-3-phosphate acyltransferase [Lacticaseibacillus sp. KACC 23028]WDF82042.1 1-acyl-sn-glycerol-3-phosphate acyltransferase [Lacticaseibacillus sp. KACC 23028]